MPYADPEKQRAAQRESYRRRYAASAEFREQEAARKAEWLQTEDGRLSNMAASAWHREQKRRKRRA